MAMFNVLYVFLPPFVIGIFEKDISEHVIARHPKATFNSGCSFSILLFFNYIFYIFFYSFTRRLSMESTLTSARLQHGSRVPFTNASSSTLPFSSRLARSLRKWISGTLICYAARILTRAFI